MTATESRCFCCRLLPDDRKWLENVYRAFSTDRRKRQWIEVRATNGEAPVVSIVQHQVVN